MPSPGRRPAALLFAAGLAAALLHASPPAGAAPAGPTPEQRAAHAALLAAEQALDPTAASDGSTSARRAAPAPGRRDATLALARLFAVHDDLAPGDRARAERLTLRPNVPACRANQWVVIHCVPEQLEGFTADDALAIATEVAETYAAAGYRRPKADGGTGANNNPDGLLDIYLQDDLTPGLYGYCSPIAEEQVAEDRFDVPAFCALRTDYSAFPMSPLDNLRATTAHEYFHAVQFAYDAAEDPWFMEATAAWAEDEVYDDIDDNVQYLREGPITRPSRPLESSRGIEVYGSWIFVRWLSERFSEQLGGLPRIVLRMWNRADSSHGAARDKYSLQALKAVLGPRGGFPRLFAEFSDANRRSRTVYEEGQENAYPVKRLAGTVTLGKARSHGLTTSKRRHLTSATYRYTPKSNVGDRWRLNVRVDLAGAATSPFAVVSVYRRTGTVTTSYVKLSGAGDGAKKVAFSRNEVSHVEVTVVNASTRFTDCFDSVSDFSCGGGRPLDDRVRGRVTATVTR
ncbi:MXAN_6640 family putative metalloprotease [Nocardioides sp. SYSU D00038]|uniref:MXAN_6640 family putative metalloprotease n=1 Tax=Nocardioides sp. SYSU D00038 TaxID=2812554 RepID=UPI0019689022|nr:MXAN_6640 family putative metalloprotease [Nocardioides sp. SYSU D00038]